MLAASNLPAWVDWDDLCAPSSVGDILFNAGRIKYNGQRYIGGACFGQILFGGGGGMYGHVRNVRAVARIVSNPVKFHFFFEGQNMGRTISFGRGKL